MRPGWRTTRTRVKDWDEPNEDGRYTGEQVVQKYNRYTGKLERVRVVKPKRRRHR